MKIHETLAARSRSRGITLWVALAGAAVALASIAVYVTSGGGGLGASPMRIGLGDHIQCAVRGQPEQPPSDGLDAAYAGLADVLRQMPANYRLAAAHHCIYEGRRVAHVVFTSDAGPVSLVVASRRSGETLRAAGAAGPTIGSGLTLRQAEASPYEIAGFETRAHMAFLVSSLPRERNLSAMVGIAGSIQKLLTLFEDRGFLGQPQFANEVLEASVPAKRIEFRVAFQLPGACIATESAAGSWHF